jgi:hypothetical protein
VRDRAGHEEAIATDANQFPDDLHAASIRADLDTSGSLAARVRRSRQDRDALVAVIGQTDRQRHRPDHRPGNPKQPSVARVPRAPRHERAFGGSHTERRQQATIEQLTLRIRRKEGRCRA